MVLTWRQEQFIRVPNLIINTSSSHCKEAEQVFHKTSLYQQLHSSSLDAKPLVTAPKFISEIRNTQ